MKILFVGHFKHWFWDEAPARAFEQLGHEVHRLPWLGYLSSPTGLAELMFAVRGLGTMRLNRELLRKVSEIQPDLIFVNRGTPILATTIRELKRRTSACVVSNNNDDPFGPSHKKRLWRHFLAGIPEYDIHFVFRALNVPEYYQAGAKQVRVLLPYFIPELHHPMELSGEERERFECDVCFVGHYEPDGREEILRALIESGLKVKLFGVNWTEAATRKVLGSKYNELAPIRPAFGDDYTKALCGARMCLALYSKLNRDTYTTRTFEIPACGSVLLSARTPDVSRFFEEDEEAIFFDDISTMIEKAQFLCSNVDRRNQIARAGRQRCLRDGHDVISRMNEVVVAFQDWMDGGCRTT